MAGKAQLTLRVATPSDLPSHHVKKGNKLISVTPYRLYAVYRPARITSAQVTIETTPAQFGPRRHHRAVLPLRHLPVNRRMEKQRVQSGHHQCNDLDPEVRAVPALHRFRPEQQHTREHHEPEALHCEG